MSAKIIAFPVADAGPAGTMPPMPTAALATKVTDHFLLVVQASASA